MVHQRHFYQGFGNIFAFSSALVVSFLFPYIGDSKRLKKIGAISISVYFIYLLLGVIALLFLIPSITEINNTLSVYILSRRVNFGTFIQRIDAVFILIWLMSIFNYLAITLNFSLSIFKRMTNIKFSKGMIFCFGSIIFAIALIPKTISDITIFESQVYKYISIIFVFFVSMLILVLAYFKKRKEKKRFE